MLGLPLLIAPLILILFFKNKIFGFISLLSLIFGGHLIIGIALQSLTIFTITSVLIATTAFDLSLFYLYRKRLSFKICKFSIDWTAFAVFGLAILYLSNVHYNYSGKYTTVENPTYQTGSHLSYSYPYFSDEWDSIALTRAKIESESLSMQIPYIEQKASFIDYEIGFHSFMAELFLLTGFDPATNYINFSIFFNSLIILLIYLLLRSQNITFFASAIAALLTLFITNGANLPGIWTLIPMTMGTLMLLLGLLFFSYTYNPGIIILLLLTMVFYPPFIFFYGVSLLVYILTAKNLKGREMAKFSINLAYVVYISTYIFYTFVLIFEHNNWDVLVPFFLILLTVLLTALLTTLVLIFLQENHLKIRRLLHIYIASVLLVTTLTNIIVYDPALRTFEIILNATFFKSFTGDFIPQYTLFAIIPLFTILFALAGIKKVYKKFTLLLFPIVAGIFLWVLYSFSTYRFFIGQQRAIFITAIFITILAGFGLNQTFQYLKKYLPTNFTSHVTGFALAIFFFLSFFYTERSMWEQLIATNKKTGQSVLPSAPANLYLRDEDLKIFSNIHNARFLSTQWKGKTIGAVTDNYPLAIKPGTISINGKLPREFIHANCAGKKEIAERLLLDYVYFAEFECNGFTPIDKNGFGLTLYKVEIKEIYNNEK